MQQNLYLFHIILPLFFIWIWSTFITEEHESKQKSFLFLLGVSPLIMIQTNLKTFAIRDWSDVFEYFWIYSYNLFFIIIAVVLLEMLSSWILSLLPTVSLIQDLVESDSGLAFIVGISASASVALRSWVEQHHFTLNIGSLPLGYQLSWLPSVILYYIIFQMIFIYIFHQFIWPLICEYHSTSSEHKFWLGAAGFLYWLQAFTFAHYLHTQRAGTIEIMSFLITFTILYCEALRRQIKNIRYQTWHDLMQENKLYTVGLIVIGGALIAYNLDSYEAVYRQQGIFSGLIASGVSLFVLWFGATRLSALSYALSLPLIMISITSFILHLIYVGSIDRFSGLSFMFDLLALFEVKHPWLELASTLYVGGGLALNELKGLRA